MSTPNVRVIQQILRAALDMYEAAQMGYTPGTMPIEAKIANATVEAIMPSLQAMISILNETSGQWTTQRNGINAKIAAAFAANEPLAGYAAKDWFLWGQVLAWFNAFLATEQTVTYPDGSTEQLTPLEAINTGYVKVQP